MRVIYLTKLENPHGQLRMYVGIHSDRSMKLWSPEDINGYIGSGMFVTKRGGSNTIAQLKPGWKHISTEVLAEANDLRDETVYIRKYWKLYGVAPEVRAWAAAHKIIIPYKDGTMLNCQDHNAAHLNPEGEVAPSRTKEAVAKRNATVVERNKTDKGKARLKRMLDASHSEEASRKRSESLAAYHRTKEGREAALRRARISLEKRSTPEGIAKLQATLNSKESHAKSIATRKARGDSFFNEKAFKNAHTAEAHEKSRLTRKANRRKVIIDEQLYDYEQLAELLGITTDCARFAIRKAMCSGVITYKGVKMEYYDSSRQSSVIHD